MTPLLEVRDLVTRFHTDDGVVHAVAGVSFTLDAGRSLALVGESGSGKTVTALSVMGLLPEPPGRVEGGQILFQGRDLLGLEERQLRDVRGRHIAMVFQDPMTSLNPVLTVGRQITEVVRRHLGASAAEALDRAEELLGLVGIPNPRARLRHHPHQFSGGQRQRIMIAIALACGPSVLIADEPTTALDVTVQAEIVALVKGLQRKLGMAILWITHDLALVAGLVDEVAVMYAGHIVEHASVEDLFRRPRHPYTMGLLRSMPDVATAPGRRLSSIEGSPPDLRRDFAACPFAPRCRYAEARCHADKPPPRSAGPGRSVACWRWDDPALASGREGGS